MTITDQLLEETAKIIDKEIKNQQVIFTILELMNQRIKRLEDMMKYEPDNKHRRC